MDEEKVLGYTPAGDPICPIPYGRMATCAVISCNFCGQIIRSMGGPCHGAICVECHDGVSQFEDFNHFEYMSLQFKGVARNSAGIIQNEGYKPSAEEVKAWGSSLFKS